MRWLAGRTIALSVSPAEDAAQNGMGPEHLNDALGEISRQLFALGARLIYGGDLRAGGITQMLFELAARYFPPSVRSADYLPSIIDVIPYPWHAELSGSDLEAWQAEFATIGELRYMNFAGDAAWNLQQRPPELPQLPKHHWSDALTAMRRYVTSNSDARIVVGGRETGYFGRMPGTTEEALTSIEAHRPLFAVGGFGGAAASIARYIAAHDPIPFPGMRAAFRTAVSNGLEDRELQRLSESPHIDEIAMLVTRGLRRLFAL